MRQVVPLFTVATSQPLRGQSIVQDADPPGRTLYLKILFVDYEESFAIIEFIGEWNDAIENDIMLLKRNLIDGLIQQHINKFILISENVMNFHSSDDCYYEEWNEEIQEEGGWIVCLNLPEHLVKEFKIDHLDRYLFFMEYPEWRTLQPDHLFQLIDNRVLRLLN